MASDILITFAVLVPIHGGMEAVYAVSMVVIDVWRLSHAGSVLGISWKLEDDACLVRVQQGGTRCQASGWHV